MRVRGETERVRRYSDDIAGEYDRFVGYAETFHLGDGRRWAFSRASDDFLIGPPMAVVGIARQRWRVRSAS